LVSGPVAAIARPARTRGEEREARDRAMALLNIFGDHLTHLAYEPVSRLSYANRRRVEIARALASKPRLLMLDEPTAGMNPAETSELAEQLKRLHGLGLAILVIDEVRRDERVLDAYLGRRHAAVEEAVVA
jgi:ABC-type branched-subunit amino acid transport system ATPase component